MLDCAPHSGPNTSQLPKETAFEIPPSLRSRLLTLPMAFRKVVEEGIHARLAYEQSRVEQGVIARMADPMKIGTDVVFAAKMKINSLTSRNYSERKILQTLEQDYARLRQQSQPA